MAVITSPSEGMPNSGGARARVIQEFNDLGVKLNTLQDFLGYKGNYQDLLPAHVNLLHIQLQAMRTYIACLQARLDLWEAS